MTHTILRSLHTTLGRHDRMSESAALQHIYSLPGRDDYYEADSTREELRNRRRKGSYKPTAGRSAKRSSVKSGGGDSVGSIIGGIGSGDVGSSGGNGGSGDEVSGDVGGSEGSGRGSGGISDASVGCSEFSGDIISSDGSVVNDGDSGGSRADSDEHGGDLGGGVQVSSVDIRADTVGDTESTSDMSGVGFV